MKIYDGIQFFSNSHTKQKYERLNDKLFTLPYWKAMNIELFTPSELR